VGGGAGGGLGDDELARGELAQRGGDGQHTDSEDDLAAVVAPQDLKPLAAACWGVV
jgi:hypothetical protein